MDRVFEFFDKVNNFKCPKCKDYMIYDRLFFHDFFICTKCEVIQFPCKHCRYHTEELIKCRRTEEVDETAEMVLMKFLGFNGDIFHNDFNRILRINRHQIITDLFPENTNENIFLKLFKPFKKYYPFEQEFSKQFIPFYVGDLDLYYMDNKCGLDKLSDLKVQFNFTKTKSYWKCDICDEIIIQNKI